MVDYHTLVRYPHLTPAQKEAIEACLLTNSQSKAANLVGVSQRSIERRIKAAKDHALKHGWDPQHGMTHPTPANQVVKGVSTLYDADGNQQLQWVKTQSDKEQALADMVESLVLPLEGKAPKVKAPKQVESDLLSVVCIGDAHLGMYSWREETGQDFDVDIASRELKEAFMRLLRSAPKSETMLILNLGDFFHGDDSTNQTRKSGNALDIDTRHERVFCLGVAVMNFLVKEALKRHKKVVVRNVRGNHDDVTSMALKYVMDAYWKDEPRVQNELSPNVLWTYEFGSVALLATHGNAPKPERLPEAFSGHFPELWGRTKYRYILHGHFHNKQSFDRPGVRTECFTNLAPNDAWHHEQGYLSPQEITLIVYHKDRGEIRRSIERPEAPGE